MKFLKKICWILLKQYIGLVILLMLALPLLHFFTIFLFGRIENQIKNLSTLNALPEIINFLIPYLFATTIIHCAYKNTQCIIQKKAYTIKNFFKEAFVYTLAIVVFAVLYFLMTIITS